MTGLELTLTQLGAAGEDRPLLVLGPSLGTSVTALWGLVAARLAGRFTVVGWDLPGHGRSAEVKLEGSDREVEVADLAAAVVAALDRAGLDGPFCYAGDSVGGAVGLQLLLDHPDRVRAAAIVSSGARIGEPSAWRERADLVRTAGTPTMVESSAGRWFAPGFLARDPGTATALLHTLQDADRFGYAAVCGALARFDVRDRLPEIGVPVLVATGEADAVTPPELGREIAAGVRAGRFVLVPGAAHLPPAEQPELVAQLLGDFFAPALGGVRGGPAWEPGATSAEIHEAGMAVRRAVLGDAHVDRSVAATSALTAEFQDLITRYAWGSIWTRPGLDRRSRSMITLTALVAGGHTEELVLHLRAARRNGLTVDEITEVLLQTAIYCGVPAANTAFRIARETFAADDESPADRMEE